MAKANSPVDTARPGVLSGPAGPGGGAAALDPSTWAVGAGWGRGRKRQLLVFAQILGAGTIIAFAVLAAFLMFASWPASVGQVSYQPGAIPGLLIAVVRSPEFTPFLPLFLLAPVLHLLCFQWLGLYRPTLSETRPFGDTLTIAKGALLGAGMMAGLAYLYGAARAVEPGAYTPLFFLYTLLLVFFGVLLYHAGSLIAVLVLHLAGLGQTRVAVIHGAAAPEGLLTALGAPVSGYRLVGAIGVDAAQPAPAPVKRLGALDHLPALINRHDLDEVILAVDPGALSPEQRLAVAQTCWQMGASLKMVTPFHPFFRTHARPEMVGEVPLLHVENVGLYATTPQILKRAMDIVISALALTAAAPVMLLAALIIRYDSPGPIFFVQERVGLNGRTFRMIKFRSMSANSDPAIHKAYLQQLIRGDEANAVDAAGKPIFKIAADPRITRFGRFIRKTSIDELPQLFNVLRGEMSLVGPRPPIQYEVDEYQDWHLKRLHIRPGITGLWQVSGRNRLSFDQMVQLDISYIERWSLWLDLKILFRTIPVILRVDQSY